MTEADNVPNYQRRVVLRAVTFNNLCCSLAGGALLPNNMNLTILL